MLYFAVNLILLTVTIYCNWHWMMSKNEFYVSHYIYIYKCVWLDQLAKFHYKSQLVSRVVVLFTTWHVVVASSNQSFGKNWKESERHKEKKEKEKKENSWIALAMTCDVYYSYSCFIFTLSTCTSPFHHCEFTRKRRRKNFMSSGRFEKRKYV